jgi:conjugative relaxase-like TrwC/TraI family protein
MITARPQKNGLTAKLYFGEHLTKGDGLAQDIEARWFGKGAARLGLDLDRPVSAEAFDRLCDNLHPVTGSRLTVRHRADDRRVFYDFTASAPKTVSVLATVMDDERLIALHNQAVRVAVAQMEQMAATRVRLNGKDEDRITGEIVAVTVQHDCSRALDPQLHTHIVIFNATYDPVEHRWKALQAREMFDAIHFFTEVYRSELAAGLKDLGYRLRRTRYGFEKAESEIASRLGRPLSNNGRATVAHAVRPRKVRGMSRSELREYQRAQLTSQELAELSRVVKQARGFRTEPRSINAAQALDHARDHLFERHSVVKRHELLREALVHGRGDVREHELSALLPTRTEFLHVGRKFTTRETLRLERELIAWVNSQMDRHRPFASQVSGATPLNDAQRRALQHLVRSTDGVVCLQGGAGTGKTHLLTTFVSLLKSRGHQVFVCAPTTAAVDVLRRDGFHEAQTVQRLLSDAELQRRTARHVIIVDEANLLSVPQFHALFHVAKAGNCRVVLSGDTRQHHSVEAGDALRVLATQSRLRTAGLDHIQRQKPKDYRAAVEAIAAGRIAEGYRRLEQMGAIVETTDPDRLAAEFAQSIKARKSALIVSPTWHEIEKVTTSVRARLQAEGALGRVENPVEVHESLSWTEAQRRDIRNYRPGLIIAFHRRTEQFQPGEWARVVAVEADRLRVRNADGQTRILTRKQAKCFDVAQSRQLPIAAGDQLLIQANCRRQGLINGQLVKVKSIDRRGRIYLTNGRSIGRGFKSFTHGYCVTSHGAEGKTVDHVYLSASSASFKAAHREQFYVSVSRGRHKVRIFTDDRKGLLEAVGASGSRLSAVELLASQRPHMAANKVIKPYVTPKFATG